MIRRAVIASLAALAVSNSPASAATGAFATSPPTFTAYARCYVPWETILSQCSTAALGGGEAVILPPAYGGNDPLTWVPGQARFYVRRITDWDRRLLQAQAAKQPMTTPAQRGAAAALPNAGWVAAFAERREPIPDHTRVEIDAKPVGCPAWPAPGWLIAVDRSGDEFDFAEMLCNQATPAGYQRVTGAVHHNGVVIAKCERLVPLTFGTFWIERDGTSVRMGYKGQPDCAITVPVAMVKPYYLVHSINVTHSTPATPSPLGMIITDVRVTPLQPSASGK